MADIGQTKPPSWLHIRRLDKTWIAIGLIPVIIALFDPAQSIETLRFAGRAMLSTGAFIVFAVIAVAYMKATGAESLLARAFEGRQSRMILFAALLGGLSPFCSCEVIPFIAALLALGAPLAAVMAFWLSSPLMDPAMFLITTGTLGLSFAVAKTIAAVLIGIAGGTVVAMFSTSPIFADPLRKGTVGNACGCGSNPFSGKPEWAFWQDEHRRGVFWSTLTENALFLGKWLLLAYIVESLMVAYVPAELIAQILGGDGFQPIILGAFLGAPAYLNGYAAVPLVDALLQQGMSAGAAMAFVIAGGISSIPAAIAVWALVKPRVFAAYLTIAIVSAFAAGVVWSVIA